MFHQPSYVHQGAIIHVHAPPLLGGLEILSFDVLVVRCTCLPPGRHDPQIHLKAHLPVHYRQKFASGKRTSPRMSVSQWHRNSSEVLSATLVSRETHDTSEIARETKTEHIPVFVTGSMWWLADLLAVARGYMVWSMYQLNLAKYQSRFRARNRNSVHDASQLRG